MDDDSLFFDWIRHYLVLIGAVVLVGALGGTAYALSAPPKYEAWSVVVQTGDDISAFELGSTAQAVFRAESVYLPAMEAAGVDVTPELFYRDHAELRPVPETDTLIVIGRSDEPTEAAAIAQGMTDALITEFQSRQLAEFAVFGEAAPIESEPTGRVVLAVSMVAAFWIAVAAAVLHFRARRPLLTLRRVLHAARPDHVSIVEGRDPRWLGGFRRLIPWKHTPANIGAIAHLADDDHGPGDVVVRLRRSKRRRRAQHEVLRAIQQRSAEAGPTARNRRVVLVAGPTTGERDLAEVLAVVDTGEQRRHLDVLWVR